MVWVNGVTYAIIILKVSNVDTEFTNVCIIVYGESNACSLWKLDIKSLENRETSTFTILWLQTIALICLLAKVSILFVRVWSFWNKFVFGEFRNLIQRLSEVHLPYGT